MNLFRWMKRQKLPPKPLLTTRQLLARFRLDGPIRCRTCGYELRGLPANGKCPECGRGALVSKLMYLADRTERSVDAFLFLIDAMKRVAAALPGGDQVHHVNARQVCGAVRDYAVEQAGDAQAALVLLADLGIQRSEEIGALVYAMIEVGIFAASESDIPEDFDGLPQVIGSSHETRE